MRVTPKISDSPADTRNSDDAPASPLSSWPAGWRSFHALSARHQSAARSFLTSSALGWNLAPSA
jgi:hypothetical protein